MWFAGETGDNGHRMQGQDEPCTPLEEQPMRKWLVPLIVFGAGGIGAYLMTGNRRVFLRGWLARFYETPERWQEWNDSALAELKRIQEALNQIASSLEPQQQPGH